MFAQVLGSEEEAKKKIYNVSYERYFGFGCEIDEETSSKLEGLPRVLFVLPDSYVDPENKDYGSEGTEIKNRKQHKQKQQRGRLNHPQAEKGTGDASIRTSHPGAHISDPDGDASTRIECLVWRRLPRCFGTYRPSAGTALHYTSASRPSTGVDRRSQAIDTMEAAPSTDDRHP
ncbi:hypothetical protein Fmac_033036 [Flemingia macrophylla]|uniref:MORF/ORRM1/DAG-like MORF domain-containing protein n=1 Tax=Flemingia macrophylla TaxID=520843 RepID=A0ABD1L827_9FABA